MSRMQTRRDFLKIAGMVTAAIALLSCGITDRCTWFDGTNWARSDGKPQRSLPLDVDYQPAPAFLALRDVIDTRKARV